MNIFVANLSFDANELDVKKLFEGFGNIEQMDQPVHILGGEGI